MLRVYVRSHSQKGWWGLVPHPCVVVKNPESYFTCRGPPIGATPHQATQPRVLVLGKEVTVTSGCENQQRL